MRPRGRTRTVLLAVVAFIAAVWFLRVTWLVTMPAAFALFLTALLWPVHHWLQRRVPLWLSVVLLILGVFAVLAVIGATLWLIATQVSQRGPEYVERGTQQISAALEWAQRQGLNITWEHLQGQQMQEHTLAWVTRGLESIWTFLAILGLILGFLVLMLFENAQWRIKAETVVDGRAHDNLIHTVDSIVHKLHRYLVVRLIVNSLSGAATTLYCWAIGIDFPLLWGILAFLLNFLPNIGAIIAFFPPALFALVQYDWRWGLVTFAGLSVIEVLNAYLLDPWLQGRSLRLSPVVVLFAVLFWGWVWGVAGAVLAVPITASLAIICLHTRSLRPIGQLLGKAPADGGQPEV